jgi:hypothetical protein
MAFWDNPADFLPKQKHRWVVSFGNSDLKNISDQGNKIYNIAAKSVDRPSYTIGNVKTKYAYSHTLNYPGRLVWNPITITFNDIIINNSSHTVKEPTIEILEQGKKEGSFTSKQTSTDIEDNSINHSIQNFFYRLLKESGYSDIGTIETAFRRFNFKKTFVESLGDVEIAEYDGDGFKSEYWTLYNTYPTDVKSDTFSYGSDEIMSITVTLVYDYARLSSIRSQSKPPEVKLPKPAKQEGKSELPLVTVEKAQTPDEIKIKQAELTLRLIESGADEATKKKIEELRKDGISAQEASDILKEYTREASLAKTFIDNGIELDQREPATTPVVDSQEADVAAELAAVDGALEAVEEAALEPPAQADKNTALDSARAHLNEVLQEYQKNVVGKIGQEYIDARAEYSPHLEEAAMAAAIAAEAAGFKDANKLSELGIASGALKALTATADVDTSVKINAAPAAPADSGASVDVNSVEVVYSATDRAEGLEPNVIRDFAPDPNYTREDLVVLNEQYKKALKEGTPKQAIIFQGMQDSAAKKGTQLALDYFNIKLEQEELNATPPGTAPTGNPASGLATDLPSGSMVELGHEFDHTTVDVLDGTKAGDVTPAAVPVVTTNPFAVSAFDEGPTTTLSKVFKRGGFYEKPQYLSDQDFAKLSTDERDYYNALSKRVKTLSEKTSTVVDMPENAAVEPFKRLNDFVESHKALITTSNTATDTKPSVITPQSHKTDDKPWYTAVGDALSSAGGSIADLFSWGGSKAAASEPDFSDVRTGHPRVEVAESSGKRRFTVIIPESNISSLNLKTNAEEARARNALSDYYGTVQTSTTQEGSRTTKTQRSQAQIPGLSTTKIEYKASKGKKYAIVTLQEI